MTPPLGARNSSFSTVSASHCRLVTSKTASRRLETVSSGPKIRKFRGSSFQLDHVAKERAEHVHIAGLDGGGRRARSPRSRGSRACRSSRSSFPPLAWGLAPIRRSPFGRQFGQFGHEPAALVEEFFRLVASHPALELLEMLGRSRGRDGERHLVGPERALDRQAIDEFRPGPALERSEDDHRPARAGGVAFDAGVVLDLLDLLDHPIEGRGHRLMHLLRLVSLDEVRRPAVAEEQAAPVPRG